jgi:hypothetical protein
VFGLYPAAMADENELVKVERKGHVLIVSINRESKRNSVNRLVADGIDAALNLLDDDRDLRRQRSHRQRRLCDQARWRVRHHPPSTTQAADRCG